MRIRALLIVAALCAGIQFNASGAAADEAPTITDATPGYYNAGIGTLLDGTQPQFPASGDPFLDPAPEPDLSAAAGPLGTFLGASPPSGGAWSAAPVAIPPTWAVTTETAIVYVLDGGPVGHSRFRVAVEVDNGVFVWVNGQYRGGGLGPGTLFKTIDLGPIGPGLNYVQVLREDSGGVTKYHIDPDLILAGPGSQLDPHVSGDLIVFSNDDHGRVHYEDVGNASGGIIPAANQNEFDYGPDVHGTRIVFSRATGTERVMFFDTATGAAPREIPAPADQTFRRSAGIGGATVVFEAGHSFSNATAEIAVHDLSTDLTTMLTSDGVIDTAPAVSADGSVVVWQKCATFDQCDIWKARRDTSGVWQPAQVTSGPDNDVAPTTDGTDIVFVRGTHPSFALRRVPAAGGADSLVPTQNSQPGTASLDQGMLTYRSQVAGANAHDIWTRDLRTGRDRQVTSTPSQSEFLIDASVTGNNVRVVWTESNADFDVATTTFERNLAPVAGDDTTAVDEGSSVLVNVLANDSDPDGDDLVVSGATTPAHGAVAVEPGGVRYTPTAGFSGTDTFDYTITDELGATDVGRVTVTVRPTRNISVNDIAVHEGLFGTTATFRVTLSEAPTAPVTVTFRTNDGTAHAPGDYEARSGSVRFNAGQTAKTIEVRVRGDLRHESVEYFLLNLTGASGGWTIRDGQGVALIFEH